MSRFKRLFYLLLLNALISAITTLAVLYYWDRRQPQEVMQQVMPVQVILTVTTDALFEQPGQASVTNAFDEVLPSETPPVVVDTPILGTYQVREGDNLGKIALEFNASVDDIMTLNGLTDPNLISVGQVLLIPTSPLPTKTPIVLPTSTPAPTETPLPSPTSTSTAAATGETGMIVESVLGAGDLATEKVCLVRTGPGELSLEGWQIEDDEGNIYIFPQLELLESSVVYLHTRAGLNTVVDLFWGLSQPAWQPGELLVLHDAQGNERATFRIP